MPRYTVDHRAGRHGEDAVLLDPSGRKILHLSGAWAVTDDHHRTLLFVTSELGSRVGTALLTGLADSLAHSANAASQPYDSVGDSGPSSVQAVKRARRPTHGVPTLATTVAIVRRNRPTAGAPDSYAVAVEEAGLPPLRFAQQADAATMAGYRNGFADPRLGVYDLLHEDGRPIARHWASVDGRLDLIGSVFDIADETVPLAETVILCLARFLASKA